MNDAQGAISGPMRLVQPRLEGSKDERECTASGTAGGLARGLRSRDILEHGLLFHEASASMRLANGETLFALVGSTSPITRDSLLGAVVDLARTAAPRGSYPRLPGY